MGSEGMPPQKGTPKPKRGCTAKVSPDGGPQVGNQRLYLNDPFNAVFVGQLAGLDDRSDLRLWLGREESGQASI
jgi:hypothetical protein